MIPRYTREKMGRLWTDETKYRTWLKVEVLASEAMAKIGRVPASAAKNIAEKADFTVARIGEIEAETRHDVIAFLTAVAEHVGPDARYMHLGMTSSDVLDTAFAVLLKEAGGILIEDIDLLMEAVKARAMEHKHTVMIGRSHGIHAEPITFGIKLAVWYDELKRNRARVAEAVKSVAAGKISGAVGTFANTPPEVEAYVCEKLGLTAAPASTQIVQRDRHAGFFCALAILASTIEKMAVELRHLQRTEVLEAEEHFAKGQKGSSAMPHKRNPIGSENLSGLARLVRANAMASLENVPLWHERDISHSSVERVIGPDSTIAMDYMLGRMTGLIKNLVVYPERMMKNLNLTGGLIFSQQVLIALAAGGISREDAYRIVQENAMRTWAGEGTFQDLLLADSRVTERMRPEDLEKVFDLGYHTKHVDTIFRRVFD
jgi:adenylosuccinate lyase